MTRLPICTSIITLAISLLLQPIWAESIPRTIQAVAYASDGKESKGDQTPQLPETEPLPWFSGIAVSHDLVGSAMYAIASYGQLEAALRINLKGRFFPIIEAGMGHSNHTSDETMLHYKTDAPYFRIGCDYNFARDVRSGNRVYGGLRAGHSNFKYDLSGPDTTDPYWETTTPYNFHDLKASATWGELCFGLEAKIWNRLHLGWTARYRLRLSQKESQVGPAWYIPGFGINDGHTISATFNFIYDIQWNKPNKKSIKSDL